MIPLNNDTFNMSKKLIKPSNAVLIKIGFNFVIFPKFVPKLDIIKEENSVPYFPDYKAHRYIRRSIKNWLQAIVFS